MYVCRDYCTTSSGPAGLQLQYSMKCCFNSSCYVVVACTYVHGWEPQRGRGSLLYATYIIETCMRSKARPPRHDESMKEREHLMNGMCCVSGRPCGRHRFVASLHAPACLNTYSLHCAYVYRSDTSSCRPQLLVNTLCFRSARDIVV